MKKRISILTFVLLPLLSVAQQLDYQRFLHCVAERNAESMAEKYKIEISEAMLQASKVFNDPQISVTYSNNQDRTMQMGKSVETTLSYDLYLSGVRGARIATAKNEKEIAEASIAAYLSALRLNAAKAWAEAWGLMKSCMMMQEAVIDMRIVAESDSIRLSVGDVSRVDAMQSRVEAERLGSELIKMRSEYKNALLNLSTLCGGMPVDSITETMLPMYDNILSAEKVGEIAEINRSDLRAAELSKTLSESNLRLVRASRGLEMTLELGYSYNSEVRNELAPAPKFNGLSIGVTIPLKFSNLNRGVVRAARAEILQSQKYYESALLQVRGEALQALNSLEAADKVMKRYDKSLLQEARTIMKSRKEGYLKGEENLMELLSAQQTFRDVMQSYIDACRDRFICQSELEYAIGTARQ